MKLSELKGIGPKTEALFLKLGIREPMDLLWYFPQSYLSFPAPREIGALEEGEVQALDVSLQRDAVLFSAHGRKTISLSLRDHSGSIRLIWFNAPFLKSQLRAGSRFVFYGRVGRYQGQLCMTQPKLYAPEDYAQKIGSFEPVYAQTRGISNALIRKCVQQAMMLLASGGLSSDLRGILLQQDFLPALLREKRGLPTMMDTIETMHFPRTMEDFRRARQRLSFNELLLFSLGMLAGNQREAQSSDFVTARKPALEGIMQALPFALTEGQRTALAEIREDMSSGRVMNRLLQGDVGSGKTIIAMLAMLEMAMNGCQAVLMAPTEILAVQHYEKLQALLRANALPYEAVLLTGSLTAAERGKCCRAIVDGRAALIVGTHALFQEGVQYHRLGLVITDEQHRFGVRQRKALSEKGGVPHMLGMSATPIPRTLAKLLYADCRVSRLSERPANRLPIKNAVIPSSDREKACRFIYRELRAGRQAYVICPMIEGNDTLELENVADTTARLRRFFPPEVRIEGLHGKLKPQEKEEIMLRFLRREIDILVSTTVVEVGVDVPNATVMLVENAERFGLAQLHQLRGRVGRSDLQSYCIFVDAKHSENSAKRLEILSHSNDGFQIAEEDLRLRGPGDLLGIRQSGELDFSMADIYEDRALLETAAEDARALLSEDPGLRQEEHALLRQQLENYLTESDVL